MTWFIVDHTRRWFSPALFKAKLYPCCFLFIFLMWNMDVSFVFTWFSCSSFDCALLRITIFLTLLTSVKTSLCGGPCTIFRINTFKWCKTKRPLWLSALSVAQWFLMVACLACTGQIYTSHLWSYTVVLERCRIQ